MHGQGAQKIVERPIHSCVNFLQSADADTLITQYFLLALEGHSFKVGTPQCDHDLESFAKSARLCVWLVGI